MDLLQNWFLMALLTPTFWAIGCLLDSLLIGSRVYRRPADGAIVSCLFCIVPVLFVLGLEATGPAPTVGQQGLPVVGAAAGLIYAVHLFFYFRTLFCLNDVSGAETFISLSVLMVPLFAWLLLAEVLPAHFYLAFLIAAAGVLMQCLPVIRMVGPTMMVNMIVSVVTVSLSMVLQSHALESHGFAASTVAFNLTCLLVASVLIVGNRSTRRRITTLCRRIPAVLIAGEALGVLAVLCSHRATEQGPSVSIVALIECLLPVFIIGISLCLISANRYLPLLPGRHRRTLARQVRSVPSKIGAVTLLMLSLTSLLV